MKWMYIDEEVMLEAAPYKFEVFQGSTIIIDYLRQDTDQKPEEMVLPLPLWAEPNTLMESMR